jgi:hypothetical protein
MYTCTSIEQRKDECGDVTNMRVATSLLNPLLNQPTNQPTNQTTYEKKRGHVTYNITKHEVFANFVIYHHHHQSLIIESGH